MRFILNVGKFYAAGVQYLGVDINALSLAPCQSPGTCDLFETADGAPTSPQAYAAQMVAELAAGTTVTSVDPITGVPKVPINRAPALVEEEVAAGRTMRIAEGSFYTKNFTATDLDGDFLTWTVTGLPGAEVEARRPKSYTLNPKP